jgi:hypothetical protein
MEENNRQLKQRLETIEDLGKLSQLYYSWDMPKPFEIKKTSSNCFIVQVHAGHSNNNGVLLHYF